MSFCGSFPPYSRGRSTLKAVFCSQSKCARWVRRKMSRMGMGFCPGLARPHCSPRAVLHPWWQWGRRGMQLCPRPMRGPLLGTKPSPKLYGRSLTGNPIPVCPDGTQWWLLAGSADLLAGKEPLAAFYSPFPPSLPPCSLPGLPPAPHCSVPMYGGRNPMSPCCPMDLSLGCPPPAAPIPLPSSPAPLPHLAFLGCFPSASPAAQHLDVSLCLPAPAREPVVLRLAASTGTASAFSLLPFCSTPAFLSPQSLLLLQSAPG